MTSTDNVPRKKDGKGQASIQNSVDASIQRVEECAEEECFQPLDRIKITQASTEQK